MPIWRIHRIRGTLLALLFVVTGLALADAAASATLGWDSAGYVGQEPQTYSRLDQASAKSLALVQAARDGDRIGIALGMSTADLGIDLRALEGRVKGIRWAKIVGEQPSFVRELELAHRVDWQGIQPVTTLLCIHYGMFAGAERVPVSRADLLHAIASGDDNLNAFGEATRALSLSWLGNNRQFVANAAEMRVSEWRRRWLHALAQEDDVIFDAPRDPFADSQNLRKALKPDVWASRLRRVEQRGWTRASSYSADSAQAKALVAVLKLLGARPGLVIVLLPEHSTLRAMIPEEPAQKLLEQKLREAALPVSPVVLNLRTALADSDFVDESHPSGEGRKHLAQVLNAGLDGLTGRGPPP